MRVLIGKEGLTDPCMRPTTRRLKEGAWACDGCVPNAGMWTRGPSARAGHETRGTPGEMILQIAFWTVKISFRHQIVQAIRQ